MRKTVSKADRSSNAFIRARPKALVAFSGGVDSTLLLRRSAATSSARRTSSAVTGVSADLHGRGAGDGPPRRPRARRPSTSCIETDELACAAFAANPADRCYHCKGELFGKIARPGQAPRDRGRLRRVQRRRPLRLPARPAGHRGARRRQPPASWRASQEGRPDLCRSGWASPHGTSRPIPAWPAASPTARPSPRRRSTRIRAGEKYHPGPGLPGRPAPPPRPSWPASRSRRPTSPGSCRPATARKVARQAPLARLPLDRRSIVEGFQHRAASTGPSRASPCRRRRRPMKIAVGLSGGVDSSVAALLLLRDGHEVTGVQMRTLARTRSAGRARCPQRLLRSATRPGIIRAAEGVCARAGHPLPRHRLLPEAYEELVLRYVREAYAAGTTPNPCVRCNPLVKFGVLPEAARAAGLAFDRFATGHYARVEPDAASGRLLLKRAADARKDQSYFLYRLSQAQLAAVLFPLGGLSKDRVRELAREAGLPVHDRKESQDFYDGDIADLLGGPAAEGDIVDRDGRVLGRHRGVRSYTVGQRKGLGLVLARPALRHRPSTPRRTGSSSARRARPSAARRPIRDCVWGPFEALAAPAAGRGSRSARPAAPVAGDGRPAPRRARARVEFAEPVSAVAPGQSAVLYDGDTVVGGGVIESAA
ncbi:MAG: hypothetical protein M0C28_06960 [Candidatus Moduliflexus flocculans]|nr:hypothetical protein [Candidatus Moduliflexus flocculans]